MIDDTLAKLEHRIRSLSTVPEDKKAELTVLFSDLRTEVSKLSMAKPEQAESITRFAELSTHESTRTPANAELQQLSLDGLAASVKGFEASHPKLVDSVNSLCNVLSSLGI
ncbi:MAG: DUF4404 family protein [Lentisphaerae bacterium]|nr:DUF4404 family protein [Lentisphaerota bacterium]